MQPPTPLLSLVLSPSITGEGHRGEEQGLGVRLGQWGGVWNHLTSPSLLPPRPLCLSGRRRRMVLPLQSQVAQYQPLDPW